MSVAFNSSAMTIFSKKFGMTSCLFCLPIQSIQFLIDTIRYLSKDSFYSPIIYLCSLSLEELKSKVFDLKCELREAKQECRERAMFTRAQLAKADRENLSLKKHHDSQLKKPPL